MSKNRFTSFILLVTVHENNFIEYNIYRLSLAVFLGYCSHGEGIVEWKAWAQTPVALKNKTGMVPRNQSASLVEVYLLSFFNHCIQFKVLIHKGWSSSNVPLKQLY